MTFKVEANTLVYFDFRVSHSNPETTVAINSTLWAKV